ncbi:hypothetical protein DY138_00630 [Apilactobacillus timberlakei]|uniref:hypothetical protein n=1 Tax=Apilactobacillus timberlakei TaxID=2008380 RepID=UPI00112B2863|nr:hypothetical protein [Apilactobacillus timberlakei]TPR19975.1 hypothetical protein DY138_00630 [Apilactobacillus timberlakei]TPR21693.1 hypothetical protein DY061_00545 [Apilactobacillus timberlakei]TPR22939.1 hypothetical protein DY083_02365 [Apilactobacillus timberlakei]
MQNILYDYDESVSIKDPSKKMDEKYLLNKYSEKLIEITQKQLLIMLYIPNDMRDVKPDINRKHYNEDVFDYKDESKWNKYVYIKLQSVLGDSLNFYSYAINNANSHDNIFKGSKYDDIKHNFSNLIDVFDTYIYHLEKKYKINK